VPVGDVAHRMNLMSATMGAGGVVLLYAIMILLTRGRRLASAFTALLFAFSLAFWSQTVIAEVYAPNVLMVTLTVWLLLLWARAVENSSSRLAEAALFCAFAAAYGLSMGTHMSNLAFAPAFAIFILLVDWRMLYRRPWMWLGGLVCFILGCLQFLWLPYKAGSLNDPIMLRDAPNTLMGIYRYTLGAFPQFKFAFPLQAIPDRIVLYLYMLRQQFGLWGILLGLYGMVEMLARATKRFYLFILMYLAHVFFFIQYRVFDLDVFFIPAHLLFAVFLGYGGAQLLAYATSVVRSWRRKDGAEKKERRLALLAVNATLALVMTLIVVGEVRANWGANDCSGDTAINDFYENVFEVLPENSVLLGQGGVFGYDMFYWRLVYDVRPDVLMPMLAGPRPSQQEMAGAGPVFTTQRLTGGQRQGGPWSPPADLIPAGTWSIPVLLGGSGQAGSPRRRELILYRVSETPTQLVVAEAQPQHTVGERLGGWELVGYDLEDSEARGGGRLHITLYWRAVEPGAALVVTILGDTLLETHEIGLGSLARYVEECDPPRDGIVVEDYWTVIPSQTPSGAQTLTVALREPLRPGQEGEVPIASIELATVNLQP
ncbi:MAG: DUF2723 domain-containing protein, partial [Chloroflexota bacterium]|nr:DUF2723 domain-containing protein [Chloroflexota bacterium]